MRGEAAWTIKQEKMLLYSNEVDNLSTSFDSDYISKQGITVPVHSEGLTHFYRGFDKKWRRFWTLLTASEYSSFKTIYSILVQSLFVGNQDGWRAQERPKFDQQKEFYSVKRQNIQNWRRRQIKFKHFCKLAGKELKHTRSNDKLGFFF